MNPPNLLVSIVRVLLPHDCRETILGDLHERYTSPLRYALDAAGVILRIRRATPLSCLPLEAALLYAGYLLAAYSSREYGDTSNHTQQFWATLLLILGMRVRDACMMPVVLAPTTQFPAWLAHYPRKLTMAFLAICTLITTVFMWGFGLTIFIEAIFGESRMFAGIAARADALWFCTLAILPLRIWLDVFRKDGSGRRTTA